jgi:hypothetical protein
VLEIRRKLKGETVPNSARAQVLATMEERLPKLEQLADDLDAISTGIHPATAKQFFFENLQLGVEFERLSTRAAIQAVQADLDCTGTLDGISPRLQVALLQLDELELKLRRAERWPMEDWYRMSAFAWRNRRLIEPRKLIVQLLSSAAGEP